MNYYILMNKDVPVIEFKKVDKEFNCHYELSKILNNDLIPYGFDSIQTWLNSRKAPSNRKHMREFFIAANIRSIEGFINVTHCTSLNDTFWVCEQDSTLKWKDVSLYCNDFDELTSEAAINGCSVGSLSIPSPELTTNGLYAKCWIKENNKPFLLKRSSETYKREAFCELYASQIAKEICNSYVPYELVFYKGDYASKCPSFTTEDIGFVSMFSLLNRPSNIDLSDVISFVSENRVLDDMKRMLILDALILNEDRHYGNFGFLVDNDTLKLKKLAPTFDHNRSLLFSVSDERLNQYVENMFDINSRFDVDFNEIAHKMLTPEIRNLLNNLKGFQFERHAQFNLPEERLNLLEKIIDIQIYKVLNDIRVYMCIPEEKTLSHIRKEDLEKQIKDAEDQKVVICKSNDREIIER